MKKQKRIALSWLLSLTLVMSLLLAGALATEEGKDPAAAADPCRTMLAGMTTEEKVSQMILPEFRHYTDGQGKLQSLEEITPAVTASLERHGYAGVVLFAQNAGETEKNIRLIDAMQKANASAEGRSQLLVAVDQEGGYVTRLGQGTQMPGNMAMGAVGDVSATTAEATIIGQELQAIGYNFNFAPVVDVNNNPGNPVIGVRSFSDDPQAVAQQGAAYLKGLQETGIISSLKHFPGHGDTATDSHTGLPCISKTYEELKACELVSFQACIDAGADAVMTAHIQYPNIEKETYTSKLTGEKIALPATLSKTILTDILRGDMGFDGVIITDAMNMDAISKHFDRLDTAKLAIEAGVDILLMPVDTSTEAGIQDLDRYIEDVTEMVEADENLQKQVDAAVLRILMLKDEKGLLEAYDGSDLEARVEAAAAFVGSSANHETEWGLAKRAITLVKNDSNVLPLTKSGQKVTVLTAYNNEVLAMEYAVGRLQDEGKLAKDTVVTVRSIYRMTFKEVKPLLDGQDHVIVVSEISRAAALDPSQTAGAYSALVDQIIAAVHQSGGKVTVLSAQLPYDVARYQAADAILVAWSSKGMSEDPRNPSNGAVKQYGPNMPAALYLALSPDESPSGKLPVNIPALDSAYQYSDQTLYARGYGLTYAKQGHSGGGGSSVNPATASASATTTGGSVKISAANARAGETVTITPQPEEGYVTTGVTVTDRNGNRIPVTQNADGTYSFTMPAAAVTVTPAFEEIEETDNPGGDVSDRFRDVKRDAWYHDAVQWAADQGIMNGVSDDRFAPNDSATRAMVVTMLWRMAGEPAVNDALPYTDVPQDMWYTEAIRWAASAGAVNGTGNGSFSPDESVTREQLAAILYRYSQAQGKGFESLWVFRLDFSDASDVAEYAYEPMCWMTMHGVINGMGDGTLAPGDNATRVQIAAMFLRFSEELAK